MWTTRTALLVFVALGLFVWGSRAAISPLPPVLSAVDLGMRVLVTAPRCRERTSVLLKERLMVGMATDGFIPLRCSKGHGAEGDCPRLRVRSYFAASLLDRARLRYRLAVRR